MSNWYVSSVAWTAVAQWTQNTVYNVGDIVRQSDGVTAGQERVFRCSISGTSGGSAPTLVLSAGGITIDNTVTWVEITGQAIYNGDGGGTAWAAPAARVETMLGSGWATSGDNVFAASNHAESWTSARTWSSQGTSTAPVRIISVDETIVPTTNLTTVKIGARFTTTIGALTGLVIAGHTYIYGFTLSVGATTASGIIYINTLLVPGSVLLDSCSFIIVGTGASGGIAIGSGPGTTGTGCYSKLKNCTFKFAAVTQSVTLRQGDIEIENCSLDPASSVCTVLFDFDTAVNNNVKIYSCDFSLITTTLFDLSTTTVVTDVTMWNCKIAPGVAMYTGTISKKGMKLRLQNCDSGILNYRDYLAEVGGTITQETTVVRTGGASNGITTMSWALSTSTRNNIVHPLRTDWIAIWNSTVGSNKTVSVEIADTSGLTNADAWLEVEYLSSSATPISTIGDTTISNILISGSALTTSSEIWGGSTAAKYKLSKTIIPQMVGFIKCRVVVAKPSITINKEIR